MALKDEISFDLTLSIDEIRPNAAFPPARFKLRDERLEALAKLWRGDFSSYKLKYEVLVNYCRAHTLRLANMLLMSRPEAGDVDLYQAAFDSIIDQDRFGGCILRWDGDEMTAPDPQTWYVLEEGGHVFARTYVSARSPSALADRINFVFVLDDFSFSEVYHWNRTTIGERIEEEESPVQHSFIEVVPRPPTNGIWGAAKYIELSDPVAEVARRYGKNSRVLDLYTNPLPTFKQSTMDADDKWGVTEDDTTEEAQAKIIKGIEGLIEAGAVSLEDIVTDFSFIQPSVSGVDQSNRQVDQMKESIAALTGMPSLTGPFQPAKSGEALKRELLPLYAESLAMQEGVRMAMERLLGIPVTWIHYFDTIEAEQVAQAAPAVRAAPVLESVEQEISSAT